MTSLTATYELPRSQSLRLRGAHTVRAQCGTLWLTLDGEPQDRVLEPGEQVQLDGHTPALVTALGQAARVRVAPLQPSASRPARRWFAAARRAPTPEAGA